MNNRQNFSPPMQFESVLFDTGNTTLRGALKYIARHITAMTGTGEKDIFRIFQAQCENNGCLPENGLLILDHQLERLTRPFSLLYVPQKSLKQSGKVARRFADMNETPVDVICVYISPQFDGARHLQNLAALTRFIGDENFLNDLKTCENAGEVRQMMKRQNALRAAA